ncbi:MAG TPA: PDZ domain-containing protein [Saprospiraceae bacterium]|nr:PDZ domain-containing protein [Saprospiraceae bacterium]
MDENPKQHRNLIFLPFFFGLVMVGGMLIGLKMKDSTNVFEKIDGEEFSKHTTMEAPLMQVIRYIDSKYVDSLDQGEFAETAIRNLIRDLDPHSVYMPAKAYVHSKEQLSGSFVGIGIDFLMINDTVTVGGIVDNGPADLAGLHTGDKILMVKDSLISGVDLTADSIVALLKGERGTTLNLTCLNRATHKAYTTNITRDEIDLPSIPVAFMINGTTGYVKITGFSATTSREFAQAVKKLIDEKGMQDLIIDLRDNPGGYLQEAVEVLNHIFLDKHKLLVYTSGAKVGKKDYESNGASRLNIKKIAVLINEESASAAEITAGALQDWDRAVIIGRRSFGKGLVQEEMPLVNGGAVRMTVARYFTPSGRCIQKDYSDRMSYDRDLESRFNNGEFYHKTDVPDTDTTSYFTANGRPVHGGGGITPEIFVAMDSMLVNQHWYILNSMSYQYILSHPQQVSSTDEKDFLKNYVVSDKMVDDFVAYAKEKNDVLETVPVEYFRPFVKRTLKAYIGKLKFGEDMYYKVLATDHDDFVKAALKQLKKDDILAVDGSGE